MSEEYGSDILTLTDEEGTELDMELLDSLEHNGVEYRLLWPLAIGGEPVEEDSEEAGFVIMKVIEEAGEIILSTVDSEEEAEEIYELFMKRLEDMDDGEDEDEE